MWYVEAKVGLISPRPYQTTWGWYSRNRSKRSSIRLQNGCREGFGPPNFQLGIQPEMLSPAILKRSTPRIPFSDMGSSLHPCISISTEQCTRATSTARGCSWAGSIIEPKCRSFGLIYPKIEPIYQPGRGLSVATAMPARRMVNWLNVGTQILG